MICVRYSAWRDRMEQTVRERETEESVRAKDEGKTTTQSWENR